MGRVVPPNGPASARQVLRPLHGTRTNILRSKGGNSAGRACGQWGGAAWLPPDRRLERPVRRNTRASNTPTRALEAHRPRFCGRCVSHCAIAPESLVRAVTGGTRWWTLRVHPRGCSAAGCCCLDGGRRFGGSAGHAGRSPTRIAPAGRARARNRACPEWERGWLWVPGLHPAAVYDGDSVAGRMALGCLAATLRVPCDAAPAALCRRATPNTDHSSFTKTAPPSSRVQYERCDPSKPSTHRHTLTQDPSPQTNPHCTSAPSPLASRRRRAAGAGSVAGTLAASGVACKRPTRPVRDGKCKSARCAARFPRPVHQPQIPLATLTGSSPPRRHR